MSHIRPIWLDATHRYCTAHSPWPGWRQHGLHFSLTSVALTLATATATVAVAKWQCNRKSSSGSSSSSSNTSFAPSFFSVSFFSSCPHLKCSIKGKYKNKMHMFLYVPCRYVCVCECAFCVSVHFECVSIIRD